MQRSALFVAAVVTVLNLGFAIPALAHTGGHGPCTGGAPVAFGVEPGLSFAAQISAAASDPGSMGFDTTGDLAEYVHLTFCDSNTPGG